MGSVFVINAGCYSPKQISNIKFQQCSIQYVGERLKIGVEPIETKEECERRFGSDIIRDNFFPLYLYVENRGNETILVNGGFDFKDKEGRYWKQADWVQVSEKQHRKGGLEALIVPGPIKKIIYENAKIWNKKMGESYKEKMLSFQMQINPYSIKQGFIVFKSEKEEEKRENFNAEIGGGELLIQIEVNSSIEKFKFKMRYKE